MSRLIDAEKLESSIRKFAEEQLVSEYQYSVLIPDILDDIDMQPTAFDVDTVVEKLNKSDFYIDQEKCITVEDAINIVKGAVKDE